MSRIVVWFKNDLRVADQPALADAVAQARRTGCRLVALYAIEPAVLAGSPVSWRQWQVRRAAFEALAVELFARHIDLQVATGEVTATLARWHAEDPIVALYSVQETGNDATFARDRSVAAWCRGQGIPWHQPGDRGVFRGLRDRDGWRAGREAFLAEAPRPVPPAMPESNRQVAGPAPWPERQLADLLPAAGRSTPAIDDGWMLATDPAAVERTLASFLGGRGRAYARAMSAPGPARTACSRLSAPLAVGSVSGRQLVSGLAEARQAGLPPGMASALRSLERRLAWRDHFTQKLEQWPWIEHRAMHSATDAMRLRDADHPHFVAWAAGHTGWPLVDACMRSLIATGWLTFRMRAMLVSVACFPLWLDWRPVADRLGRLFADFDPGIHYPQVQMQAGATGINALRVYDPVRQSRQLDPDGRFIREWLPELRRVPDGFIHEPWRMPAAWQRDCGLRIGVDYPAPLVDWASHARDARARIAAAYRGPDARAESARVFTALGSRERRRERARRRPGAGPASGRQGELF